MDEPDLPPIPALRPGLIRKRTRSDYEAATSSDPALFSSDEHAPNLDSYATKRRKEQWKGTWWGAKTIPVRKKRSFRRNFDSGIFLGSEDTDMSLVEELLDNQQGCQAFANVSSDQEPAFNNRGKELDGASPSAPEPSKFDLVRNIVYKQLEDGLEDVNLSYGARPC